MPELRFIPNEAGEGEGLSDAGIETYRADPFPAVARETSQNSRDAHDSQRCPDQPVRLEIDRITIPTVSLPGHAAFRQVVLSCLEQAEALNSQKEVEFFRYAASLLDGPELHVLRVADFNTTGLRGPCIEGKPFHALVKSAGVSSKDNENSGGSFGIGKSAVYSASDLQAVFYSTQYIDGSGTARFLAQGKTRFRSFHGHDGKQYRSIGYWGEPEGFMPVTSPELVPDWLRRSHIGTTVCSIAVRQADNWQDLIAASLVMNFFRAIQAGEMEFAVAGEEVNHRTLQRRFDDPTIRSAARDEEFGFARDMFECLISEDAQEHVLSLHDIGRFRLRLLVRDGLPKRVGILRNGMYICDNLGHFGDRLVRFAMHRDFAAVVEPIDDDGNAWLRSMENPRHDEFSPERLLDPVSRARARGAGKRLAEQIRSAIKAAAHTPSKKQTDLDELSEFFALDTSGERDDAGPRNLTTFKVQQSQRRARTRRSTPPVATEDGDAGGGAQEHGEGSTTGGSPGDGTGDGEGGKGRRNRRRHFPLSGLRSLLPDSADSTRRRIIFTPEASGVATLQLMSAGLSERQVLLLANGEPQIECREGERIVMDVAFREPYAGPIEVVSWTDASEDA